MIMTAVAMAGGWAALSASTSPQAMPQATTAAQGPCQPRASTVKQTRQDSMWPPMTWRGCARGEAGVAVTIAIVAASGGTSTIWCVRAPTATNKANPTDVVMATDATARGGSCGSSGFLQRIGGRFGGRVETSKASGIPGASDAMNATFLSGRETDGRTAAEPPRSVRPGQADRRRSDLWTAGRGTNLRGGRNQHGNSWEPAPLPAHGGSSP